nr:hypothetical protein [uncultured bacterium]
MPENTLRNLRTSPDFRQRISMQHSAVNSIRENGESQRYVYTSGDYGISAPHYRGILLAIDDSRVKAARNEKRPVERLTGVEMFMKDSIDALLRKKNGQEPVVVLDVGSFVGMSWHRLANQYKEEVESGKIVFVTSSISHEPEQQFESVYLDRLTPEAMQFVTDTAPLVQHVTGSISQLLKKEVNLPNRQKITLGEHVDLLYESKSVTAWSKVPELDLLRIPQLLSDQGTYLVPIVDTLELEGETKYSGAQRLAGISEAHERLVVTYGLKKVTEVEEGQQQGKSLNYVIFRRQNAPAVRVDEVHY